VLGVSAVQEVGNVLTVAGILVTFVGYFGQHGLVRLRELEPGLVDWWNRSRVWLTVKLGRSKSVNIQGVAATVTAGVTVSGTAMVWSPPQPDDDLETRVDKLQRNLEALRSDAAELRQLDQQRFREVTDRLAERATALELDLAALREEGKRESTWAMRWEVRGLLITLVGAGLSVFG
jgi:hypothetical protein